jgi:hypothetical protein
MRKQLDENTSALQRTAKQFGLTGDSAEEAGGKIDTFQQQLEDLKTVDISPALDVFEKYLPSIVQAQQEAEKLKNSLKDLKETTDEKPKEEGWFWRFIQWWDRQAGTNIEPKIREIIQFEKEWFEALNKPGRAPGALAPTVPEQWNAVQISQFMNLQSGMEQYGKTLENIMGITQEKNEAVIQGYIKEQEAIDKSKEAAIESMKELKKQAQIKASFLKEGLTVADIDVLYKKQVEDTIRMFGRDEVKLRSKLSDLATSAGKAYMDAYKNQMREGSKDIQNFIDAMRDRMNMLNKYYQGQAQAAERAREIREMDIEKGYELTKIGLDRESALLEEYYSAGILSAKQYYAENQRLIEAASQFELARLTEMKDSTIKHFQALIDINEKQIKSLQVTQLAMEKQLPLAGTKEDRQKIKEAIADIIPQIEALTNKIAESKGEIDKVNQSYEWQKKIIDETLKTELRRLQLQKLIAEAQESLKIRQEELNVQRDITDLYIEANELTGNWQEVEKEKIKLLEIEKGISDTNYELEIRKLEILKSQALIQGDLVKAKDIERLAGLYMKLQEATGMAFDIKKYIEALPDWKAGLYDLYNQWSNTAAQMQQIAEQTAVGMHGAFSDFFFDMMKGELKSLEDYIISFLEAISKAISDVFAQRIVSGLMSLFPFGGKSIPFNLEGGGMWSGGTGGLAYNPLQIFQTGTDYVPRTGLAWVHRGEKITPAGKSSPNVEVAINIKNTTGQPVQVRQSSLVWNQSSKQWVKNVVLELASTDPAFRSAMNVRK